jgi:DNA-binding MarR family transcriptional regulator
MPDAAATDRLDRALTGFMRYFLVHINPILHRTEYRGRSYSELEIIVCMVLSVSGTMRPAQISRALSIEKGTLTSVIRRLVVLALVERTSVVGDERGYQLSLTPEGWQLVDHLAEQRRRGFGRLFATLDPSDADAAVRGIEVLTRHLKDWEDNHGPQA